MRETLSPKIADPAKPARCSEAQGAQLPERWRAGAVITELAHLRLASQRLQDAAELLPGDARMVIDLLTAAEGLAA